MSTVSATNLNIGMDLWNASSAGASAASGAATPPTIMGREVTLGEPWIQV